MHTQITDGIYVCSLKSVQIAPKSFLLNKFKSSLVKICKQLTTEYLLKHTAKKKRKKKVDAAWQNIVPNVTSVFTMFVNPDEERLVSFCIPP